MNNDISPLVYSGRRGPRLRRRLIVVITTALSCVGAVAPGHVHASPGDLDPAFGSGGLRTTDFGHGPSAGIDAVLQPDGKLVVLGIATGRPGDVAIARYNPDGSLDPTFSGDGQQATYLQQTRYPTLVRPSAVALQPDGKIVVVGHSGNSSDGPWVIRFNADGSFDSTFAGDGALLLGSDSGSAEDVVAQPDGKLLIVGDTAASDIAIMCLDEDGSLDPTFSGDGRQQTDLGDSDSASALALQPDGRIVVAGTSGGDFALARYDPDGSLDTTFSTDGIQTTDVGGSARARGVALKADGDIVAVGTAGTGGQLALASYNADGSLDTTFSGDGVQVTELSAVATSAAVAQSDGKIVVGGASGSADFALARYGADGALDATFSVDGVQASDFGAVGTGRLDALALQPDAKIVAVGASGDGDGASFAVARYNADGSPDASFSSDGLQTTAFGGFDTVDAVAVQPDGKIVVAGTAGLGNAISSSPKVRRGGDFALARYDTDGSLDMSFSGDGKLTTDFGGSQDDGRAVALQPDGRIVVAGGGAGDFEIARYTAAGALDTTFSDDGKLVATLSPSFRAEAIALQPDGKILVAGGGFVIARLNPDGSLDTTFAGDGTTATPFFGGASVFTANALAIASDGKIVEAGSLDPNYYAGGIARYNPDGSLDPGFGGGTYPGVQTVAHDSAAMALQPDGKILVAGIDTYTGLGPFFIHRLNANGSHDATFADNGTQRVWVGDERRPAVGGIAIRADGTIAVAGASGNRDAELSDIALTRLLPDGSLDGSFSSDGVVTTDFGEIDAASAVALESDGDIIAAGHTTGETTDFATVRYDGGPPRATPSLPARPSPPFLLPPPSLLLPPPPSADRRDLMAPVGTVSGPGTQRVGRTIVVNITCPAEACRATVRATVRIPRAGAAKPKNYRLANATKAIAKGATVRFSLDVPARVRAVIRRALRGGKKVTVTIGVVFADGSGNKRTVTRHVKLKL